MLIFGTIEMIGLIYEWDWHPEKTKKKIPAVILSIALLMAGIVMCYQSCYWYKDVSIYTADGEFIQRYEGKYEVNHDNNRMFSICWWKDNKWHKVTYNNKDYSYIEVAQ